jgi:hypothetical protein
MTSEEKHNCRDDNRIISDIEKYGLSVIILEATEYLPSFAYSIGLWGKFKLSNTAMMGQSKRRI